MSKLREFPLADCIAYVGYGSSISTPDDEGNGGLRIGVSPWVRIKNIWYRWDFTDLRLKIALEKSRNLTADKFIKANLDNLTQKEE